MHSPKPCHGAAPNGTRLKLPCVLDDKASSKCEPIDKQIKLQPSDCPTAYGREQIADEGFGAKANASFLLWTVSPLKRRHCQLLNENLRPTSHRICSDWYKKTPSI